jgi:hypothetical protein
MKLVKTAMLLTLAAAAAGMLTSRARRTGAGDAAGAGPEAQGSAEGAAAGGAPGRAGIDTRSPNAGERVQAALAGGSGALSGSSMAHDDLLAPGSPRDAGASASGIGDQFRGA